MDYLNANGLRDGRIPPHTKCPFVFVCTIKDCRHKGKDATQHFSCAFARGYSLLKEENPDQYRWHWMMAWCRRNHLSPTLAHHWAGAAEAYEEYIASETQ